MSREAMVGDVIHEDGLRYKSKQAGSVFPGQGANGFGTTQMSCYKCGAHQPIGSMVGKRFLGKVQKVCGNGCAKKS